MPLMSVPAQDFSRASSLFATFDTWLCETPCKVIAQSIKIGKQCEPIHTAAIQVLLHIRKVRGWNRELNEPMLEMLIVINRDKGVLT